MGSKCILSLTAFTFLLILSVQIENAEGIPALQELPSITSDTINDDPFEPIMAESVGPIGAIAAYTTLGRIRGMFRGDAKKEEAQESHGIRYYLSPMRIARSMGSMGLSMARTFYDTFQQQFQESLKNIQETTIPQAATYMGVWTNPPEMTDNQWMTGI